MHELFGLQDKIVCVTGGLGQLGRQFTKTLLALGAKVAVFDLHEPDSPHGGHGEAHQDRLLFLQGSVTSKADIQAALEAMETKWGTPHGLVNNAALDSPPGAPAEENGPFETYPESSFETIMDVNVKGVFLCCQVLGGAMARAGRGSVVNICSTYGMVSPNQDIYEYRRQRGETFYKPVAYAVSKAAVLNLTRYLATYWGRQGVRVNSLSFGGVFNNQDTEFLEEYGLRTPMGRMAREDEYNGAVAFLLGEASSYTTGANIVCDGGWTAW